MTQSMATISASPMNTSKAKASFSFGKQDRFGIQFKPAHNPPAPSSDSPGMAQRSMSIASYESGNIYETDFTKKRASAKPFGTAGPRFGVEVEKSKWI